MAGCPVLVAARFSVVDPEPEVKIARVLKTHPYVRGGGLDGLSCCPVLKLLNVNGDQVHMVFSAVTHSFQPRQVLMDQNQVVCGTFWQKSKLNLYKQQTNLKHVFDNTILASISYLAPHL